MEKSEEQAENNAIASDMLALVDSRMAFMPVYRQRDVHDAMERRLRDRRVEFMKIVELRARKYKAARLEFERCELARRPPSPDDEFRDIMIRLFPRLKAYGPSQ